MFIAKLSKKNLRTVNLTLAALHFMQGTAVALLSQNYLVPVKTDHLVFNTSTQTLETVQTYIFDLSLPMLIILFFYLSAAAHLYIGTIHWKKYNTELSKGINRTRWFEYALSASVMIVAISLLVGATDISILFTVFALTAVMNLTGLLMEVSNQGAKRPDWSSFLVGTFAGMVPWCIIVYYFWASAHYGDAKPPTFVYWIFVSIFAFFSCFAVNMWLQYKKIGPWKDYLYGEKVYMLLSLVAKSALAWQVFAGTLRP